MTDLERLQASAALEQIVDAADAERQRMEYQLAARKQQAAYDVAHAEYVVQVERSKAK